MVIANHGVRRFRTRSLTFHQITNGVTTLAGHGTNVIGKQILAFRNGTWQTMTTNRGSSLISVRSLSDHHRTSTGTTLSHGVHTVRQTSLESQARAYKIILTRHGAVIIEMIAFHCHMIMSSHQAQMVRDRQLLAHRWTYEVMIMPDNGVNVMRETMLALRAMKEKIMLTSHGASIFFQRRLLFHHGFMKTVMMSVWAGMVREKQIPSRHWTNTTRMLISWTSVAGWKSCPHLVIMNQWTGMVRVK
mmetsp:Transcript_144956/g.263608  ORF Transcript_144956/g.263608 Transcript_144956/m.263608 type:complete len:246 (-) Transcript_144956:2565-3302(-)